MADTYAGVAYWNGRYSGVDNSAPFDWYYPLEDLEPLLPMDSLPKDKEAEILIPGCGTSGVGAKLAEMGYANITCIDSSEVAIKKMKEQRGKWSKKVDYVFLDAAGLRNIPDGTFDFIFDKAFLDAAMCEETAIDLVPQILCELHRVLREGGRFLSLSHAVPSSRNALLHGTSLNWAAADPAAIRKPEVQGMRNYGADRNYYLYCCTKLGSD